MLIVIIRLLYFIICAGTITAYINTAALPEAIQEREVLLFFGLLAISQTATLADIFVRRKRIEVISAVYFGVLIGSLLSYLMILAIGPVLDSIPKNDPASMMIRSMVLLLIPLVLSYFSVSFLLQTKDDFRFVIPYVEFSRELKGGRPLVLDSSALIDGRINDVANTGILDARLVVPTFILKEVQDIADSNDKNRRTRGRRGLEVLSKLQANPALDVTVDQSDHRPSRGLTNDQRLIEVAREVGGRIVTNDFNLSKVALLQSVETINLNDVANALKPRYLPGDKLKIRVVKEGESAGQGVGYLADGTMVVCEQASQLLNAEVEIVVTSVLQSSAGRMIFGRKAVDGGDGAS